jgi:hypothetical protein
VDPGVQTLEIDLQIPLVILHLAHWLGPLLIDLGFGIDRL